MTELAQQKCVPCSGGVPPLEPQRIEELLPQLDAWRMNEHGHLARAYRFADFRAAFDLVSRISELAEQEGHHPDIRFGWGYVDIEMWTHAIDGLSESDFILAAKIDRLVRDAER